MQELGLDFEVRLSGTDETLPAKTKATEAACLLASRKADAMKLISESSLVITADTIVILGKKILGKPAGKKEAIDMLNALSGKTHQVITGVCLMYRGKKLVFQDVTKVVFRKLTQEQILHYVEHWRPFDKAGGYAIQEWIGMVGISKIEGDYYNVMGLPVGKLYRKLFEFAKKKGILKKEKKD